MDRLMIFNEIYGPNFAEISGIYSVLRNYFVMSLHGRKIVLT